MESPRSPDTAAWCLGMFARAEVLLGTGQSLGDDRRTAPPPMGNHTGPPNVGLPSAASDPYAEPRADHTPGRAHHPFPLHAHRRRRCRPRHP